MGRIGFQLLGIAFLVFQVSGMSRQEAVRDVGLQGSGSSPDKTELRQAPSTRVKFRPEPVKETNEGFIPENPFADFETAASNSHFTVIDSEDDFFAQESSPFGDFYGFDHDRSPFAASDNHREYLSPYAASHTNQRRVNFEDYGPPKGFFDDAFMIDFGSNNDDKKKGSKATQESRAEPKYDGAETKKQDDKTKKCQKVNKDGMTCEICKDDYGGFSEHCSHSLHSGKDQKFANSRRDAHDEIYDPLNLHRNHQPAKKEERKASNNDFAYNSPSGNRNRNPYSESQPRTTYQAKEDSPNKQFERANLYHPFADQSKNNPYNSDKSDAVDELIDTGLKDVINRREKVLSSLPAEKAAKGEKGKEDVASQASQNKQQQQHQRQTGATQYKQLDPNENFKILGSMVKKFAKKDRSKCKKKQTKDGMTCYVCPNKHGQVDEECMYEKADPQKGGVHMMYKEEVTY